MAFQRYILGVVLCSGLMCLRVPARAQSSFVQQFAGSTVLLASGDTLRGPLVLHRSEDVLLISRPNQPVTTLSAVAVQAFAVKGETGNNLPAARYDDFLDTRNGYFFGRQATYTPLPASRKSRLDTTHIRLFRTYRWNLDKDYSDFKAPGFFEQLSAGPVYLLRRQMLVERTVSDPYGRSTYGSAAGSPMLSRYGYFTDVKDLLYLANTQGEIVPLRNPRKDLLSFFQANSRQLEQYAKLHKLRFTNSRELANIVNYANSLQSQPVNP